MSDENDSISSQPAGLPKDNLSRFLPEGRSIGDLPTELVSEQESIHYSTKEIIADQFEVEETLGFGGMGIVYKVKDNLMHGRYKALKVILPSLVNSEAARKRFISEAEIAQQLRHDGIVTVFDIREDRERDILFLTMELLEGENLAIYLKSRGGRLPFEDACGIILQVCNALEYSHSKDVIHRDIKPQNIFVLPDGTVKLLDFGLAKLISPGKLTRSSMGLGTAYYMAPEQSLGKEVDKRADIYSIGVVFYQLLVGQVPMGRFKLPSELNRYIPGSIDTVLETCLKPSPEDRCRDASELTKEIKEIITTYKPPVPETPIDNKSVKKDEEKPEQKTGTGRKSLALISIIVLLLTAGVGLYIYKKNKGISVSTIISEPDKPLASQIPMNNEKIQHAEVDSQTQLKIASLLASADEQINAQNFTSPEGNNAFSTLKEILYIDPANKMARSKLDAIRDKYMQWGNEAYTVKQYVEAKDHFEKAVFVSPGYAEGEKKLAELEKRRKIAREFVIKGKGSERNEEYEKALEEFNKAHQAYPEIEGVDALIAGIKNKISEKEERIRNIAKAEKLIDKGKQKEINKQYEEALSNYNEAKKINPTAPEINMLIASVEGKIEEERRRADKRRIEEERRKAEAEVMVYVKGGCFQMGDTFGDRHSDEKPVHEVCVDDIYIGKYEVTQKQWREVMGDNPSHFNNCGDNCPVEKVSWDDVQAYIRKLNQNTGKSYRLPTEAEWEYACRSGGKREKYSGGSNAGSVGWNGDNSGSKTHPVGQKSANGLGIYDMSGNVWEWVSDWKAAYSSGKEHNPKGPGSGSRRVRRGGSWGSGGGGVRCSRRNDLTPGGRRGGLGFRLASTRHSL